MFCILVESRADTVTAQSTRLTDCRKIMRQDCEDGSELAAYSGHSNRNLVRAQIEGPKNFFLCCSCNVDPFLH